MVIHTEWNEYRGLDLLKVKELKLNYFRFRNIFNLDDMKKFNIKYYGIGLKLTEYDWHKFNKAYLGLWHKRYCCGHFIRKDAYYIGYIAKK